LAANIPGLILALAGGGDVHADRRGDADADAFRQPT